MPTISVIMSALNAERTIEAAVRSVIWQSFKDWELIVIDDGSTDSTSARVAAFPDSRIQLVNRDSRRGLATRLNEAVALSRGRYIARMDADDISYPERFEIQHAHLEQHAEVDLSGSAIMAFSGDFQPIGVLHPPIDHEDICASPHIGFSLAHPTWMGRADFFKSHPYNGAARRAQDQDLLLRSYTTARFMNVPTVLLGYRQERVTAGNNLAGRLQYCRSMTEIWGQGANSRMLLRGLFMQAMRGAVTIPAIAAGFDDQVVRRRYSQPTAAETAAWASVVRRYSTEFR